MNRDSRRGGLFAGFAAGSQSRPTLPRCQPQGPQRSFSQQAQHELEANNWQDDIGDPYASSANGFHHQQFIERSPLQHNQLDVIQAIQSPPVTYGSQVPKSTNRMSLPARGNTLGDKIRSLPTPRAYEFTPSFTQLQSPNPTRHDHFVAASFSDDFDISQADDVFHDSLSQSHGTQPARGYQGNQFKSPQQHQTFSREERFRDGAYQQNHPQQSTQRPKNSIALGHAPKMVNGVELVPKYRLPDRFQTVFDYDMFNAVQSKCFAPAFEKNDNMVLSAPTGSGKTVVMELAVCRLVGSYEPGTFKAVYLAPTKSLCSERKRDWERKFTSLGIKCTELTGDTALREMSNVKNGDIIISTPEKWDSMTRRWQDHRKLLELVRLFMIDEAHILKDDRGATLEVVVSRMKTIGKYVRFIAVSATVPNPYDLSAWLGKNSENLTEPAHEACFGENYRPVKLEKVVLGYKSDTNDFMFLKFLDSKIMEVIQKYSAKKPIMVFCWTRKECEGTAKLLAEKWSGSSVREQAWKASVKNFSFKDKELHALGKCGVAFHHAGLDVSDRNLVEKLYLEGELSVICCTSTLAVGINLPAHLVVLKGTQSWSNGQRKEYDDLEVLQMLGRAGRPQFDDSAVAVIMTRKEKEDFYRKMISGAEKLESCLHKNLAEHLNAEIGLGTIKDVEDAKRWLKSTFLFVRMKGNPEFYQLEGQDVEAKLENMAERDLQLLHELELVVSDGAKFKPTESGNAMARYYINLETMENILNLKDHAKRSEILMCISEAKEFKDIRFRAGEKSFYKLINSSIEMKWPLKTDIATVAHKVYILMQFETGSMQLPNEDAVQKHRNQFNTDKALVCQHVNRIVRCLIDVTLARKDAISTLNALEIARSFAAKAWENSPSMLRQLEGFGPATVKRFVTQGIKSLDMLDELESTKIEMIAGRNPTFGAKVKQSIESIPKFNISGKATKIYGGRGSPVKVTISLVVGLLNQSSPGTFKSRQIFVNIVSSRSDGYLIDFRRIPAFKLKDAKNIIFETEISSADQKINCHVACEEIVGTTKSIDIELKLTMDLFPPPQRPSHIERPASLEVQPSNVSSLVSRRKQTAPSIQKYGFVSAKSIPADPPDEDEYGGESLDKAVEDMDFSHLDNFTSSIPAQETKRNTESNSKLSGEGRLKSALHRGIESEDEDEDEKHQLREDGKRECSHHCKDKKNCKHFCCHNGVEIKRKRKSLKSAVEESNLSLKSVVKEGKHSPNNFDFHFTDSWKRQLSPPAKKRKVSEPNGTQQKGKRLTLRNDLSVKPLRLQNRLKIPAEGEVEILDLSSSQDEMLSPEEIIKRALMVSKINSGDKSVNREKDSIEFELSDYQLSEGSDIDMLKSYGIKQKNNDKFLRKVGRELGDVQEQKPEAKKAEAEAEKNSAANLKDDIRDDTSFDFSSIPFDEDVFEAALGESGFNNQTDSTDTYITKSLGNDSSLQGPEALTEQQFKNERPSASSDSTCTIGFTESNNHADEMKPSNQSGAASFDVIDVMEFLGDCFEINEELD